MRRARRPTSMVARAAVATLALLLVGQGGAHRESGYGDVAFGPEVKEFRMGIALQKAPAVAGHPIAIRYSFENTRKPAEERKSFQDSVFLSERGPGKGLEVSLVDARGEEVPKTVDALDTTRRPKGPSSGHMSRVKPGQTQRVGGLWLHNHYDLSMPGRYRFRVTRYRFSRREGGSGDLASGEIVFDVLEPPAEAP